jgi:hypothetical protein
MLEDSVDRSSSESEMRTVISLGETVTYGELMGILSNKDSIKSIEAEMLYMDASSKKIYLMCKSCAPMYHGLVTNILDIRQLDSSCVFIDSKNPANLLNMNIDIDIEIWMAVHSHTNDMIFMVAPITMAGPAYKRLRNGQCVTRNDIVSFWGEM